MALPVSRPGDASEIEADRVADAVMRGAAPGGIGSAAGAAPLHRACAACEDDEPRLQRQADGSTGRPSAAGIGGLGTSQALDAGTRRFFEPRLGHDLSDVQVHTGAPAAAAASALQAHAFTLGRDIAFAQGRYRPDTPTGQRLLAHELAHVLQSRSGGPAALQRSADYASPGGDAPANGERPSPGIKGTAPPKPMPPPRPESCPPPPDIDCRPAALSPAVVSQTLGFNADSARLGKREKADVDAASAAWRRAGSAGDLRIDGYASAEGDCGNNWQLSCRRAHAVADELASPSDHSAGVPTANIELFAHGESDEAGRGLAANRRATISVPAPSPSPSPAPAPATPAPAPCAMPVLLGTGRTGCGAGATGSPTPTDFRHNDHPSISAGSELQLGTWAAIHLSTGHLPIRSLVPDLECMVEMDGVLSSLAGAAGHAAFAQFVGGSGGTMTHGATSALGALALPSAPFVATVAAVTSDIEAQLAVQAASGTLDACALAVIPPATSWRFSLIPPLEAVIGGTHGEKLFADAFSGSASTRSYSIALRFVICDNFGVDEHDLYPSLGLYPFWVLQHERGGGGRFAPFVNELELPVTLSGTF